jgi:hypothetical protein
MLYIAQIAARDPLRPRALAAPTVALHGGYGRIKVAAALHK